MPGRSFSADHSDPPAADTAQTSPDPTAPQQLSQEQVDRWAILIASGETEFPSELPAGDQETLLRTVRRLLRDRLVAFVARMIALELQRESADGSNETCHD
jgi:hypothetical protein